MLNRLYYLLKPIIPRRLQLGLRRLLVASKLKSCSSVWPVDPTTAKKPSWFSGWPDGKQFALLITHDVEMAEGLSKLDSLLEIDRQFQFRSSVGLVPERYTIDPSILQKIKNNGHELYVHDLNHDGKLFSKYSLFHERLIRINRYLASWNVNGFRAGAMHHNLDWIGELDINYDMSTFDTDPFEPMPDGIGTIFPFIASSTITSKTFVEIPYTLPQDLLTLVIHPARSIDIWIRKLNWIAEHNGMASVNIHPDYIQFSGRSSENNTYLVEHYHNFLNYIKDHFSSSVWNALPSEIVAFVRKNDNNLPQ